MKIRRTPHFERAYKKAPGNMQGAFDKQPFYCSRTSATPRYTPRNSMRAVIDGRPASLAPGGFTSQIAGDTYILQDIIPHPK